MKIFKENSYDIVRLYVNQLGIMIFSMLLYTAVGAFENESLSNSLSVFVSVFSTCFYLALIYYMMWEIGAKDKIRIDGGRMVPCKLKGLLMGAFANLPNFVLGALSVLTVSVYLIGNVEIFRSAFIIFNTVTRFHDAMLLGVITEIVPGGISAGEVDYVEFLIESILFTVLPAVSLLVTHLAYSLGLREKKLLSLFKSKK